MVYERVVKKASCSGAKTAAQMDGEMVATKAGVLGTYLVALLAVMMAISKAVNLGVVTVV